MVDVQCLRLVAATVGLMVLVVVVVVVVVVVLLATTISGFMKTLVFPLTALCWS